MAADNIIHENLVSIADDTLRVEKGPRRIVAPCTAENLRKTGRSVPGDEVMVKGQKKAIHVVYDAVGKKIRASDLGVSEMTVLDKSRANWTWYLYRWETVETDDGDVEMWVEKGTFDGDRDEAVAACKANFGGAA